MHDKGREQYTSAAVIGGGLIGTSWTALFLGQGLRVTVHDPRPDIEPVVRTALRAVAPTLRDLGMEIANLVDDTGSRVDVERPDEPSPLSLSRMNESAGGRRTGSSDAKHPRTSMSTGANIDKTWRKDGDDRAGHPNPEFAGRDAHLRRP